MKEFHLKIATPDGIEYDGMAESLLIKTSDGDVEILAGHTELIASVGIGRARILYGGTERFASAAGGFLSVTKEAVKLVCTTFEFADTIDIKRAEAAKARAEELLRTARDKAELGAAEAKLARALNRINVSSL